MYPENPEGTRVIVGSVNMGYVSDTARNRTHNLFRPKCILIPLGHSDGYFVVIFNNIIQIDLMIKGGNSEHWLLPRPVCSQKTLHISPDGDYT